MTAFVPLLVAAAVLVVIMALLWLRQRQTGNAGTVDIAWSFGTGLAGVWLALAPIAGASSNSTRQILVAVMVAVWAIRLGSHVWHRVVSEEEDGRYRELRESWGDDFQRRLFWFFQMQAVAAVLFAVPIFVAARNPDPAVGWTDYLGVLIWVVALSGESIADRQLARFKATTSEAGQICDRGLWRFSRHPNYFFEWVHWFAYVVIAFGAVADYHWAWLTLMGPGFMLHFLLRVTGVPSVDFGEQPFSECNDLRSLGSRLRTNQKVGVISEQCDIENSHQPPAFEVRFGKRTTRERDALPLYCGLQ